jgi:hypothetical protein
MRVPLFGNGRQPNPQLSDEDLQKYSREAWSGIYRSLTRGLVYNLWVCVLLDISGLSWYALRLSRGAPYSIAFIVLWAIVPAASIALEAMTYTPLKRRDVTLHTPARAILLGSLQVALVVFIAMGHYFFFNLRSS